jgi:hypothetical protein
MLTKDRWSPYFVGFLLALLSLSSFFFLHKMLGTSVTFVRLAAALTSIVSWDHVQANSYYMSYLKDGFWIDWQMAMVIGTFLGSYLAKKRPTSIQVPKIWNDRFGPSPLKRNIGAFLGGILLLFGARLAGGCTSGHCISGGMQLAVSGWVYMMGLFAAGVPFALLMYRRKQT